MITKQIPSSCSAWLPSRRLGSKTHDLWRERRGGPKPGEKPSNRTCKTKPDRPKIAPEIDRRLLHAQPRSPKKRTVWSQLRNCLAVSCFGVPGQVLSHWQSARFRGLWRTDLSVDSAKTGMVGIPSCVNPSAWLTQLSDHHNKATLEL